jgi:hypothetical protein
MSPAPKYRTRTCNVEAERKGVGSGERRGAVETLFYAVRKRVEGTGMADEADEGDGWICDGANAEILRFAQDDIALLGAKGRCAAKSA